MDLPIKVEGATYSLAYENAFFSPQTAAWCLEETCLKSWAGNRIPVDGGDSRWSLLGACLYKVNITRLYLSNYLRTSRDTLRPNRKTGPELTRNNHMPVIKQGLRSRSVVSLADVKRLCQQRIREARDCEGMRAEAVSLAGTGRIGVHPARITDYCGCAPERWRPPRVVQTVV